MNSINTFAITFPPVFGDNTAAIFKTSVFNKNDNYVFTKF